MSSKLLFNLCIFHKCLKTLKRPFRILPCKIGSHLFPRDIAWLTSPQHQSTASWTCTNRTARASDWPALGPQALSNAELIAILLRVGVTGENAVQVGQRLLNKFDGLQRTPSRAVQELMDQHGLGEAKASQIKAAIELGRRLTLESPGGTRLPSTPPPMPPRWCSMKCPRWSRNICA